jgi:hypothetical protein
MPLTVRFASDFGLLIARTRVDGIITSDLAAASPAEAWAPGGLAQALLPNPSPPTARATRRPARRRRRRGRGPFAEARFHRPGQPHPPEWHLRDHRHRRGGPAQWLRFCRPVLRTSRRHPRRHSHRRRRHRAGPLLVVSPRPRQPHRPARLRPHRPGPSRHPRRPGPPHRSPSSTAPCTTPANRGSSLSPPCPSGCACPVAGDPLGERARYQEVISATWSSLRR